MSNDLMSKLNPDTLARMVHDLENNNGDPATILAIEHYVTDLVGHWAWVELYERTA